MVKFKFLIGESFKRRFNNRGMRVIRGMGLGLLALFSSFTGYSQENIAPVADTIYTSYVSPWENLFAINDGFEPLSSTDNTHGAYGNWPRLSGEVENWDWVQYSWDSLYLIDRSEIYWWRDGGGIRIPDSSYIQYRDIESGDWKEISGDSGFVINVDEYSVVTFEPVLTNAIRYYMMSMTESTGVLEWKIFGTLVEQDLYNSTIEVTPELAPGVTGTVKVTAVESGGGRREGYTFRMRVKVRNELTGANNHDESYIVKDQAVNGMLTELILDPTDANGETFFNLVLPPAIDPTDGITIDVMYNDGLVRLGTIRYYIPAMLPPALTADNTGNSVDDDIDITFNDDFDWRVGCSEVLVGEVALAEGTDYDLAAGLLKLKPSGLNSALVTSGIKEIRVKAPGYEDAVVIQEIMPGQPSKERSVVETLIPLFRGVQTSLLVVAKDRYGNLLDNCQLWYEVNVISNNLATDEVYSVNGLDVSSDQPDRELPLTGKLGRSVIGLAIPMDVDPGDGIMIYVKTGSGSVIDSAGYIDASVTGSLISGRMIGEIAVAGRLYTEIHTLFMMARNENRRVLNWYNLGYSGGGRFNTVGGNFGNFGFDVPLDERNTRYPLFDTIGGLPSVCFDGNNFLKSGYASETDITGGESFTIEMWVYDENPTAGEVIMGWQSADGTSASAPLAWPAGIAGNDRWRHLVVSSGPVTETWYLDGEVVRSVPREMRIDPGHRIVLGGSSENSTSFDGCLLTLRVHRDSITLAQVVHNYRGGGMLGTTLRFNFDPIMTPSDDKAYFTWSDADPGAAFMVVSEHFDQRLSLDWINTWPAADKDAFYARVPAMLELAEACYENYGSFHALRLPVVSIHPKYRGDGIKYRIKIGTTDGANFMGWHDRLGFGYGMQFPGYFNPHELVHGTQAQTGSGMQGNYWEAHANWPQTYMGIYQTVPSFLEMRDQNLFEASGRSYYHARLMFQHLAESPEYGPQFISKIWFDGANTAYPWITFKEIDPDPLTSLGYEFGRMVQKNVTWDYTIHRPLNPDDYYDPDLYRNNVRDNYEVAVVQGYVLLDSISGETGWLRPPKPKIPQQTGWNIVPLEPVGSEVSAELSGYRNEERGSSWYGGFVSVNNDGISRYSDIFREGESLSFTLNADEPDLYFIVAAIPGNIMAVDMTGDVKSDAQEPFPYKVRFTGVRQRDMFRRYYAKKFENISGHIHANGGGFVDNRAIVSATAYVGPGAYVIGTSQVLDSARLEDFAVVENSTVKDHAIVSGHGNVMGNSTVSGYARVRDFARVSNSSGLTEYGKVAEHASLESGNGNANSGYTTMKGIAIKYDGDASGTAMIDHHFAKGQDITIGKWFSWSWGSGRNPGEEDQDFNGLYMSMSFEEDHPFMAWDDHGITWGYLVNGASLLTDPAYGGVLSLDGYNQYVELQGDVSDQLSMTLTFDVNWDGGQPDQQVFSFGNSAGNYIYFTPSDKNGKMALVAGYEGEVEKIVASEPLEERGWANITIYSGREGTRLYMNDELVGMNQAIMIANLTIAAGKFSNYIGRNQEGSVYFNGMIDNFTIYNGELSEPVGIVDNSFDSDNYITVFPNPAYEYLTVKVNSEKLSTITILDLAGNTLFRKEFLTSIDIGRSEIGSAGFYFVVITEGSRRHTGKLILN